MRRLLVPIVAMLCLALSAGTVLAAPPLKGTAGSSGIGDPYFPDDGNGGYDVIHYDLDLGYEPETDVLTGLATIEAVTTQALSRFQLDYDGPTIQSVAVDGAAVKWKLKKGELIITPDGALPDDTSFTVEVAYAGVAGILGEEILGVAGWLNTDDGALALGQPHGATTWFPANDHPLDTATFTIAIEVPTGLEAISNGRLVGTETTGDHTTWTWDASAPMATYLAMVAIGEFDIDSYSAAGIDYWDAIDPDLMTPVAAPTDGESFAISQQANLSYKRLLRVITVPADGATMSFDITRFIEEPWDFVFVEAHTVGADDWTTLQDLNGHTSQDTGFVCPFWLDLHPFLTHYQTATQDGCTPSGSSGEWWAATGRSDGAETWMVDLSAFAGAQVEVSITYASDDIVQLPGVFVDDIEVSTGEGSTSFEADADPFDGWTVPGAPADSPGNENDWIVGTVDDIPPPEGEVAAGSFARQPEIIAFLAEQFGPYPFGEAGGVVDDPEGLGFALETQTRPIYARDFFDSAESGDAVVVHELAHQWYGDSLTIGRWQDIWLNEGFATYAEWLWSEDQGLGTAQEIFDFWATVFPPEDEFWQLTIGDPGPDRLFDFAVYIRGGMTLHALRGIVGDADFFEILQTWASTRAGTNVTTPEFIALAESISGQDLDAFFDRWLFTPGYPLDAVPTPMAARAPAVTPRAGQVPVAERIERFSGDRPD
ncbi:MAG TPA: M1 family aminopeptidase [Candidatus Saccharimonadales bacterium]|nr:M1 family aminopeptidase [Candidatus Saccharimonadales bacterium]